MKKPELVGIMWKCGCGSLNSGHRPTCGGCNTHYSNNP